MSYYKLHQNPPSSDEPIAIDTQVAYWMFYADDQYIGQKERTYQILKYPRFLQDAINHGNKIVVFGGVLLELFKIIERNEYSMYRDLNGINEEDLTLKQYRQIEDERKLVKEKLDIAFKQIQQFATICYDTVDENCCATFVEQFEQHRADFVDFSLVQLCAKHSIHNILTDDGDFKTIASDINIYSENRSFFEK